MDSSRLPGATLILETMSAAADRLECLFFGGFDPLFEGDESLGL
jgi:hypothetical protein